VRTSRTLGVIAAASAALMLAACATGTTNDDAAPGASANPGSADAFPVTIEHAFGETTIEELPERVASVAWANHEVPLALGVVPVIMERATFGDDDDNGVLPWVEEKIEELGAETPELYDGTAGIDFEAVAASEPDVILASYSGITQEDYDTLSQIAPTVAYPEIPWTTTLEQMIEMNSTAIGLADEGDALIEQLNTEIDDAVAANDLAGTSVVFTYLDPTDLSQIGFYTAGDPRAGFLIQHGFVEPTVVTEESATTESFYVTVSAEQADRFDDVDLLITYGDDSTLAALQADPLLSQIPAVAEGHVAVLGNTDPIANVANPTPLSVSWGMDDYMALLADALQ
jgi:iron complex transport system substrate-binding protein